MCQPSALPSRLVCGFQASGGYMVGGFWTQCESSHSPQDRPPGPASSTDIKSRHLPDQAGFRGTQTLRGYHPSPQHHLLPGPPPVPAIWKPLFLNDPSLIMSGPMCPEGAHGLRGHSQYITHIKSPPGKPHRWDVEVLAPGLVFGPGPPRAAMPWSHSLPGDTRPEAWGPHQTPGPSGALLVSDVL